MADLDEGFTQDEQDQKLIVKVNAMVPLEGEVELKEITRLTDLVLLFEGFDIPYLDNTPEAMY